ncbi:MAG: flagella assembly protein FlgT middle domain-containing protein [Pseudomonadota bacterium]
MLEPGLTQLNIRLQNRAKAMAGAMLAALACLMPAFAAQALPPQPKEQAQERPGVEVLSVQDGSAPAPDVKMPAHLFKKKVVAAAFDVVKPGQLQDIDDIAHGFPRELLARLERSGKFLTRSASSLLGAGVAVDVPNLHTVRQLAEFNDSQFVIAGQVVSAESWAVPKFLGLLETKKRLLAVEIYVFDGLSGVLLTRHRFDSVVEKEVVVGRDKTFGGSAFFATAVGRALDDMLDAGVRAVSADLEVQPFAAKVVRISNNELTFDAGANSAIVPGDVLGVYRISHQLPLMRPADQVSLGTQEGMLGRVAVSQVQLGFSVGALSADSNRKGIQVGDLVRWYPAAP